MNVITNKKDINLLPGEFYFGGKDVRICTLLGSCISITVWHPKKLIGGMCHFMLPSPMFRKNPDELNGKYAEDTIKLFMREIQISGTKPSDYEVKIFGGGNMFPNELGSSSCNSSNGKCLNVSKCKNISCQNILTAIHLLKEKKFKVISQDLGGIYHRKIIFELWSGDVWLKKGSNSTKSIETK